MNKKEKPLLIFPSGKVQYIFYGIFIIFVFIIIYLIAALKVGKYDYFSLFFNNISNHIFLTVLSFIHVGFLGSGILIIIFAYFNLTPRITAFNDRFEIKIFLQKKIIVPYNIIKNTGIKICFSNNSSFFNKFTKECRVYFNNPVYYFYFSYPVSGYFDNVEMSLKKDDLMLLRRCLTNKEKIDILFKKLKKEFSINTQFLPEETKTNKIKFQFPF
jgi:hypothetical protein